MPDSSHTELADNEGIRLYGLIGYPLTHSFSKKYFDEKFEREGLIHYRFENFSISSIDELKDILRKNRKELSGLAVTIPYKQLVLRHLHSMSAIPDGIRACNCIKIVDGKLIGFNTDWFGFEKSFTPLLQQHHTRALVLGNGGATEAVCFVLKRLGIHFEIVSRKLHDGSTLTYNDLSEKIIKEHQVIINTTPLGTFPDVHVFPLIPYKAISSVHYLFDLIYNPEKTVFLQKGEEMGATIKNGADMLTIQADENWRIWNSGC